MIGPKIITGSAKGIELKVPEETRPVTGRIKQSVFDTLGDRVTGTKVLDLFAGSGNMGIEALSRGATSACFVDIEREVIPIIKDNLLKCKFGGNEHRVIRKPADKFLKESREKFDLIFLDPPFPTADEFPIHLLLKVMTPESIVVWRKPTEQSTDHLPKSLEILHTDYYGSSSVVYLDAPSLDH